MKVLGQVLYTLTVKFNFFKTWDLRIPEIFEAKRTFSKVNIYTNARHFFLCTRMSRAFRLQKGTAATLPGSTHFQSLRMHRASC